MKRLTLDRRQHHSAPDFEQQRSDLEQGQRNLVEAYQGYVEETVADESLSYDEKRSLLEAYKADLEQAKVEYQAELERIEETQQFADDYGVSPKEGAAWAEEADAYCTFEESMDETAQMAPEEPAMEGPTMENDLSY